jgi:chromosome segregation ATPase
MTDPTARHVMEIESEKRQLRKADADIEAGWNRLQNQHDLLASLRANGENTREAERLMLVMEQTLTEWERHRVLIQERIAYLQSCSGPWG